MGKITEKDIEISALAIGYEFRIKKFTTEKEWKLCSVLEDILLEKYGYDCNIHDLDSIGFVVLYLWERCISPIGFRKILVSEINKLITKEDKED